MCKTVHWTTGPGFSLQTSYVYNMSSRHNNFYNWSYGTEELLAASQEVFHTPVYNFSGLVLNVSALSVSFSSMSWTCNSSLWIIFSLIKPLICHSHKSFKHNTQHLDHFVIWACNNSLDTCRQVTRISVPSTSAEKFPLVVCLAENPMEEAGGVLFNWRPQSRIPAQDTQQPPRLGGHSARVTGITHSATERLTKAPGPPVWQQFTDTSALIFLWEMRLELSLIKL